MMLSDDAIIERRIERLTALRDELQGILKTDLIWYLLDRNRELSAANQVLINQLKQAQAALSQSKGEKP